MRPWLLSFVCFALLDLFYLLSLPRVFAYYYLVYHQDAQSSIRQVKQK